jgi:choline/glycine/proline betaine transport protein
LGLSESIAFGCHQNASYKRQESPRAVQNPRSWQRLGLIMHYPHTQAEV